MAHDAAVRTRARTLFIGGRGLGAIARKTGVARATLQRWKREEDWDGLRTMNRELEREAQRLALQMTRAAQESEDPQQAYAAMQAARIAGLAEAPPIHPAPAEVAKVLLAELAQDAELGPLVRRRRREIIDRVSRAVERLEAGSVPG